MKTTRKLLLAAAVSVVFLSGCEKSFLDKESMDSLGGEFVTTTEEGMEMLLEGVYNGYQASDYYGCLLYIYEAAKGPDFFVRNASGGFSLYYENDYSESKSLNGNARSLWVRIYNIIRNTSILIDNIDEVPGDIDDLRRIKGEAYALRGLAYFDLCRLFAYPPKFSCTWGSSYNEDFKWGVPIIDNSAISFDVENHEIMRATIIRFSR